MSKEYEYDARATLSAAVPMIEFDLASQNAALFAALMPFAKECERWGHLSLGPDIDHWNIGGNSLTLGDLRRARDAIAKATGA